MAVAGALVPPAPEQVSVYVVGEFTAPVARAPLAPTGPVQPPEAVQDTALVELHVSVDESPMTTLVGEAPRLTVGAAGRGLTVTEVLAAGLTPPGPEHVTEKLALAESAPVLREPEAASAPLQPPAARHAVAWVEDQVSVDEPPAVTVVGVALSAAVGASTVGGAGTGEDPPPQPESTDTAPSMNKRMKRMEFRSERLIRGS